MQSHPLVRFRRTDQLNLFSRMQIVGPHTFDLLAATTPFLTFAISKGVKRFVFLSTTAMSKGDQFHGLVHQWLADREGIEYAVIRPSWFDQNFVQEYRLSLLKDNNIIVSAAGDGAAAWVDCEDIAEASARALTEVSPRNGDYMVVGPETLSYGQVSSRTDISEKSID